METNVTDTVETDPIEDTPPAPEPTSSGPAELRAALERSNARAEAAEAKLRNNALKGAGLLTAEGEPTKLGKAVIASYDGEWDAESVAAFVTDEFGIETKSPVAQVVTTAQARVDAITSPAVSSEGNPPGTDIDEQIRAAEEAGDVATSIALKTRKFIARTGVPNQ